MQSEESLLHIHLQVLSNTTPPTIPNTTLSAHFDKKKVILRPCNHWAFAIFQNYFLFNAFSCQPSIAKLHLFILCEYELTVGYEFFTKLLLSACFEHWT